MLIVNRPNRYLFAPGNFDSLMDLYEQNYLRLHSLIPSLDAVEHQALSQAPACLDLHLSILEKCKYTSMINLTYHFKDSLPYSKGPDLEIRVYHDAKLAEASGGLSYKRFYQDDKPMDKKLFLNRFLYKWLGYCLCQGHCFVNPQPDKAVRYLMTGYINRTGI